LFSLLLLRNFLEYGKKEEGPNTICLDVCPQERSNGAAVIKEFMSTWQAS
jgi:hypothetical protein